MIKIKTAKNVSQSDLEVLTKIYFKSFKESYKVKRLTNNIIDEVEMMFNSPKTIWGLIAYEDETPVGFTSYTEIFSSYRDLITDIVRRRNKTRESEYTSELNMNVIYSIQVIKNENEQLCSERDSEVIYPSNGNRFYLPQKTDILKIATAVDPSHRRKGIASSINASLEKRLVSSKKANQVFTLCRAKQPIIRLNLNAGYAALAEVTNFYNNDESCIILGKRLKKD